MFYFLLYNKYCVCFFCCCYPWLTSWLIFHTNIPDVARAINTVNTFINILSVLIKSFPFLESILIWNNIASHKRDVSRVNLIILVRLIWEVIFLKINNFFIIQINACKYSSIVLNGWCCCKGCYDLIVSAVYLVDDVSAVYLVDDDDNECGDCFICGIVGRVVGLLWLLLILELWMLLFLELWLFLLLRHWLLILLRFDLLITEDCFLSLWGCSFDNNFTSLLLLQLLSLFIV